MTLDDIDLFEVNEAFAVVPVKFMRDLNVDHSKVNVNGGAIAWDIPLVRRGQCCWYCSGRTGAPRAVNSADYYVRGGRHGSCGDH